MRLEHLGAARTARLTVELAASTAALTIVCDDLTGWPTGSSYPFYAVIDRGTDSEEKVLCLSRSGDVITVYDSGGNNGRAEDNTAIAYHSVNATIEHCGTALEADAANAHVEETTTAHGLTLANLLTTTNVKTVTGKTMSGADNTFSAIPQSAVTDLVTNLGTKTDETSGLLTGPIETATISATAATGTVNFDAITQAVLYYTTSASANWTLNVRGSSGVSLNTLLAVGQSITITFLVTQGSTAYYQSALTVDGGSVTPKWQGGSAPTAGNASGVDAYTVTILKTANATFTAFASQTRFA